MLLLLYIYYSIYYDKIYLKLQPAKKFNTLI